MVEIQQEGTVTIEVQQLEDGYRARVDTSDAWWPADTVRLAVRGAANTAIESEIDASLGSLWEHDDDL